MNNFLSRRGFMLFALVLLFAVGIASPPAQAQDVPVLTISVPGFWEDILTPDVLAEFESQYGVQVHVKFGANVLFVEASTAADLDSRLETTAELASSADVVYIDSTDVTVEDTQAGYFLNIAPLINNDPNLDVNDFIPSVWESFQWDQGIWALPISTDVIILTYDPALFDAAGVAYPNENWTVDDFANATRQLAQYYSDGTVAVPGLTMGFGSGNLAVLLRSLVGHGFYDTDASPSSPQFTDEDTQAILQTWQELLDEGVVSYFGVSPEEGAIPMQIASSLDLRGGFGVEEDRASTRQATLMPGGTAGLNVQGFAVSSGTQYPELAYELAKFLTTRSELANDPFSISPARYSVMNTPTNNESDNSEGLIFIGGNIPEEIQAVVDEALTVAMPASELRYGAYLTNIFNEMSNNGLDAVAATQLVEATAVANQQSALENASTVSVIVETLPPVVELTAGETELNIGVNDGFGIRLGNSDFINQEEWDQLNTDYVASDAAVGRVNLSATDESDLKALTEQYDCFILSDNVVAGNDVSPLLNLDPLLDTDPNFDRNNIVGNALVQLQQENRTYGIPIVVQPQMLRYDTELFALAGIPAPIDGWTIDEFAVALRALSDVIDPETLPFTPNDPSGAYMNMLIAAYGGLPIDYRTNPPTLNFTDSATVDAIRQALDLAKDGYIDYSGLSSLGGDISFIAGQTLPITSELVVPFRFGPDGAEFGGENTSALVLYPQGSQYGVISYKLFAGYISNTAENPEACYRWLSEVARNPELFTGMPAQRSLINDPDVVAAQGEDTLAVYNQIDAIMQNPNTIVFPSSFGLGRGATNFLTEYWLKQAYDRYILEDADLEIELMEAQATTQAYLDCVETLPPTDPSDSNNPLSAFEGLQECGQRADPDFSLGLN